MWVSVLLALLLCAASFILCSETTMWGYHFVNKHLTWSEAQQFCRKHYHDLACVSSAKDNQRLPRPPGHSAPVWIGLYDDPTDLSQWKWTFSAPGNYSHWSSFKSEPQYRHEMEQCGTLGYYGWQTCCPCSERRYPLCFSGSNPKVFYMSSDKFRWRDAVDYCRVNYTDLARIDSKREYRAAWAAVNKYQAWIGLYRNTANWSDNRPLTFIKWHMLSDKQNYHEPFCVVENVHNSWEVSSCQEKRTFYCQAEPKSRRFVKVKFSGQNLSTSGINQDILDKMQQMFDAAGRTDVKVKWKSAPKKQEKKKKEEPEDLSCPSAGD